LIIIVLCLGKCSSALEFDVSFNHIDRRLTSISIGRILHYLDDIPVLARLLDTSGLPLYKYYLDGCPFLTWQRISHIQRTAKTLPESSVDALLSPYCLAKWPGLWAHPRRLETFLLKHPHSNPLYAFGDLIYREGVTFTSSLRANLTRYEVSFEVLLEAASEAMLSSGLSAEASLFEMLSNEVIDWIDPVRFPRLFTPLIFDALREQIDWTQMGTFDHWHELDRLIWSLNYCEICRRRGWEIGAHPVEDAEYSVNSLYSMLQLNALLRRARKTTWSVFMRELLRPGDGIGAQVIRGAPLTPQQGQQMEAASLSPLCDSFSKILIYRWLNSIYIESEIVNYFSGAVASMPFRLAYSALEVFGDDEVVLQVHLETNLRSREQIPLFLADQWIIRRRLGRSWSSLSAWQEALINFFSFSARRRLFLQYTKAHSGYLSTGSVDYELTICVDGARSREDAILEDLGEELRDIELLNVQDLTAIFVSDIASSSPSPLLPRSIELSELFNSFLEALFLPERRLFFRNAEGGVYMPHPWIRPRLWLRLGRFFTIAFQRGLKFPHLKLKRSVFVNAFKQCFEAYSPQNTEFIGFENDSDVFEFNVDYQFPEIAENSPRIDQSFLREALTYACKIDDWEHANDYVRGKSASLFVCNPQRNFLLPRNMSVDELAGKVTSESMFKFWIGLEPLTAFFSGDEVYDALFE
jgi:hypothetical protein